MVVVGGRTERRHGDAQRRQRPPWQIVPEASFFNCSTMRLCEIRMNEGRPYMQMWREGGYLFAKLP